MKKGSNDFIAFVSGPDTESVVQTVVSQYWPKGTIMQGGTSAAMQASLNLQNDQPRYVVVDLEGAHSPETEASKILSAYNQAGAVVFIGDRNDVAFYRSIMRLGAGDYLVKPFTSDELYSCLINAGMSRLPHDDGHEGKAKLIAFVGARGGVGTTSVLVNSGWILAEEHGRSTALVDLDVHFGTVALSLDVEPSVGFRDALESPSRVDSFFIESALVASTPRLSVLAAEENLDTFISYNNTALEILVEKLRENREFVLVDTPRTLLMRCEEMMAEVDTVVIVSELTVPALRDTVTIINKVKTLAADMGQPNKDIRVIVNKEKGKRIGQINLKDFEKEIELPVAAILPDMPEVACVALNDGKPMLAISGNSKLVEELRNFCNLLDGKAHTSVPKGSMFKKLLGTKA
jgi:pilus assembly protein CpaE